MNYEEKYQIAKSVKGFMGQNYLNWLTDFNMELKRDQFTIFFHKESEAKKAISLLTGFNAKIVKTPRFINTYFKYGVLIIL